MKFLLIDFKKAQKFYSDIFDFDMPEMLIGQITLGFFQAERGGIGGAIAKGVGRFEQLVVVRSKNKRKYSSSKFDCSRSREISGTCEKRELSRVQLRVLARTEIRKTLFAERTTTNPRRPTVILCT